MLASHAVEVAVLVAAGVVDDFDVRPDVRELVPLLATGSRVVVATRRSATDNSDELIRQLTDPRRYETLKLVAPSIMELLPLDFETLGVHLEATPSPRLQRVIDYLSKFPVLASDHLRRPLLLRMMVDIGFDPTDNEAPVTIANLYKTYTSAALSRDYDFGRSRIPEGRKASILSELAFDIFRGVEPDVGHESAFLVTYQRIQARVNDEVQADPTLRLLDKEHRYAWTEDFLTTNHVLSQQPRRLLPASGATLLFSFDHPTLFEYFISIAMLDRFSRGITLGITKETLSEATFRSLTLYFIRAAWGSHLVADLERLLKARLTWVDRLIILFILEPHVDFPDILAHAGTRYLDDIETAFDDMQSYFIRKVISYQLIVAGRWSAFDYVSDLRLNEQPDDYNLEWQIHAGTGDVTTHLLYRASTSAGEATLPILIFRMGQMGDIRCSENLERLKNSHDIDERLRFLAAEALDKIQSREFASNRQLRSG